MISHYKMPLFLQRPHNSWVQDNKSRDEAEEAKSTSENVKKHSEEVIAMKNYTVKTVIVVLLHQLNT